MRWNAVVLAVRHGHNTPELQNEVKLLEKLNILKAEEILIVEDACEDAGSAGSVLNALLVTAERLTAKAGLSVLSEEVFRSAAVLVLLVGPKRGAFQAVSSPAEWGLTPDTVLVRQMRNLEILEAAERKGLWICGTDSCFSLKENRPLELPTSSISVFTIAWETDSLHGSYQLDSSNHIEGIEYPSTQSGLSSIVLSLFHFPPSITAMVLSLHSVYPLSASTYYGEDTGTLGLKLSLFFDLLLATCLKKQKDYLNNEVGQDKIDQHRELRHDARLIIWERLHKIDSFLVKLTAEDYHYFTEEQDLEQQRDLWLESLTKKVTSAILSHSSRVDGLSTLVALYEVYGGIVREKVVDLVEKVCEKDPSAVSRALYVFSEFLFLRAGGRGGLRMGPAANNNFTEVFCKLQESENPSEHVRKLLEIVREGWMDSEHKLVRAGRHLEAAAQIIYGKTTLKLKPQIKMGKFLGGQGVRVQSAARVDIFGGWLDTPPIAYETSPSAVINMAVKVDGQLPLCCEVSLSPTPGITFSAEGRIAAFSTIEKIRATAVRPSDHGALLCACFHSLGLTDSYPGLEEILLGFYGSPGIVVKCSSTLPHGSGLGTSSILACCIIVALLGEIPSKDDLIHLVLCVEFLLTSGGGFQDQVGGIYPGIKIGEFDERVRVKNIPVSKVFENEINDRLMLIYTGKTRLAKNLLQEVIRNWYVGGEVAEIMKSMQDKILICVDQLREGHFPVEEVELYYQVKKKLATGCEPFEVAEVIKKLKKAEVCETAWLAGAGGGGFLYAWLTQGKSVEDVRNLLSGTNMTTHSIEICDNPLQFEYL